LRAEATGYELVFFSQLILDKMNKELKGLRYVISGSGKIAMHILEKLLSFGVLPITLSDSGGYLVDEEGFDFMKITVKEIIAKNPQSKYLDVDHDPLAQVFGKSTKLLRTIMEGKESYIDLENRFSKYKAENDAKLDSLRDMVTSLKSFERVATPMMLIDHGCLHLFSERGNNLIFEFTRAYCGIWEGVSNYWLPGKRGGGI
ncbi:hypothetical protein GIB67_006900, partial [Kingdonia uniflora]